MTLPPPEPPIPFSWLRGGTATDEESEEASVSPRPSGERIAWTLLLCCDSSSCGCPCARAQSAAKERLGLGRLSPLWAQSWAPFGRRALAGALAATSACLGSIPLQSVGLLPRVRWDHRPTGCGRARRSPRAAATRCSLECAGILAQQQPAAPSSAQESSRSSNPLLPRARRNPRAASRSKQ